MKYHTTLSTIIISLIVLLCFALAVVFCVTSLGITSPGYLIVDQILTRIDNTTDFRPARERIFICGETLKGEDPSKYIRQKYGHHGPGVDHNQQFDNGIMGLNSLKEARDKNNKIIYSSGLSCFQPH